MSDVSVNNKLQPVERFLRYTSYIILSSPLLSEKCYTYQDETDHNDDEIMTGYKSIIGTRDLPFGTGGCIAAWELIWT